MARERPDAVFSAFPPRRAADGSAAVPSEVRLFADAADFFGEVRFAVVGFPAGVPCAAFFAVFFAVFFRAGGSTLR